MGSICKFKGVESSIIEFIPYDLSAYRFVNGKYFESRELNGQKVFLEFLIKGKVNVYYLRDKDGDHYYLDKEGVPLSKIEYEEGIKHVDDRQVFYQSKRHIGMLSYYMQDATGLQSRIQSMGKPEHRNLIKLAEDYHYAVCEGEKCIVYEKPNPFISANVEALVGVVNFENVDGLNDKFYLLSGIVANIWLPRTNEKIYFKTGFMYAQPERYGNDENYLKIIAHIAYIAPSKYRVRPTFSIGLLNPSYSGGAYYRITEKLKVGVQSWVTFDYNMHTLDSNKIVQLFVTGKL
jgi:hypothetical protein